MFKIISQLTLVFCLLWYWYYNDNSKQHWVFFPAIAFDSLLVSISFIITAFFVKAKKEMIIRINQLYPFITFDRYIWYIVLELFYRVCCGIVYQPSLPYFADFLVIIGCTPVIINIMHQKLGIIQTVFKLIASERQKFTRAIITKQMSGFLNCIVKIVLNQNPKISHKELEPVFDHYEKFRKNINEFIKEFIVISFLNYAKNNSNAIYSRLIKLFYTAKRGEMLHSLNLTDAETELSLIVQHRKWEGLFTTKGLLAIECIYSAQNNTPPKIFLKKFHSFNHKIVKLFTVWTLAQFFQQPLILPIASLTLHLIYLCFQKQNRYKSKLFTITFCLASWPVCVMFHNNYLLGSIVSELGHFILCNRVSRSIEEYIYRKVRALLNGLTSSNKLTEFLVLSSIYLCLSEMYFNDHQCTKFFMVILSKGSLRKLVYLFLLVSGYFSNYSVLHMTFLVLLVHASSCFYHWYHFPYSFHRMDIKQKIVENYQTVRSSNTVHIVHYQKGVHIVDDYEVK